MSQHNPLAPPSRLDPVGDRCLSFIFKQCQARLEGENLLVTVPLPRVTLRGGLTTASGGGIDWTPPLDLSNEIVVEMAPGPRRRTDGREYPVSARYPQSVTFRFKGGYSYGRLALTDGWALGVQGPVRSMIGLPGLWTEWEAVLVETGAGRPETRPSPRAMMMAAPGSSPGDPVPDDSVSGPHLPYP